VTQPRLVFAATPVGVYRSSDGGLEWVLPGRALTVPLASAVAVSPDLERDRTIFACGVDGLYRSTDLGDTWQRVLIGDGMLSVATSLVGPDRQLTVIVGTEADGILRSEDAGRTWIGANAGLLDLTAISLAVSPSFASDRTAFAGTASGLYRTRNGARSWRSVETGLEEVAVQCLLVSPAFAEDHLVLAGTEGDGLLRSVDGGSSWTSAPTLNAGGVTALACANETFLAATEHGVMRSGDGGQTWQSLDGGLDEPTLSLALDGACLLAGLHRRGVLRSLDGGATWAPALTGLSARLDTELALSTDFERDRTVFVAGPEEGIRASSDGGIHWEERNGGLDDVAVYGLSATARGLWAATGQGVYVSHDRGRSWRRSTSGDGEAAARIVGAGSSRVVAAFDGGRLAVLDEGGTMWRDLRLPAEESQIVALAVAHDGTILVAGIAAGELTLWRWENLRGWSRLFVESSSGATRVALAVSPAQPVEQGVLVGFGRRVLRPLRQAQEVRGRERRPIWRSTEPGRDVANITSLAISPVDRTVFAASNAGVFLSRDGGGTFDEWSEGLSSPRVVALAVSPNYVRDRLVYALGLGGTIWRRID
jgi:photosystem II stability/assembly factor-like uncharacterized protein